MTTTKIDRAPDRLIEIRSYKLKPGSGARFHALVTQQSLPLLRAWGTDVVGFGPSAHDPDAYFLIRAYDSLEHRRTSQQGFYASEAWRSGPRAAIIELIESDHDVMLRLTSAAIEILRDSCSAMA